MRYATVIVVLAVALAAGCRQPSPAPPPTASAPAAATAPPETLPQPDPSAEIDRLEAEARRAVEEREIAGLRKSIAGLKALKARRPETIQRRDALTAELEGELATLADALHRFLFAELSEMPLDRRKQVIADAETGRTEPLSAPAKVLAKTVFDSGQPHLRSTKDLRGGTTDPASRLPVRYAGPIADAWKAQFNDAYNAEIRRLAAKTPNTAPSR